MKVSIILLSFVAMAALATATPLACASSCTVTAATTGYSTAVFDVKAGAALVWHSTDIGHVQKDGASGSGSCLSVRVSGHADSDAVVFSITNGVLSASTAGGPAVACTNAHALPDGSFAMPYFCAIHSSMRGTLVVSP